jgi:hypothetical protein
VHTFRRLNDPERYYGLSWRGWVAVCCAGGVLYAAVRVSPLATKPTVTITVLLLAVLGTLFYGLSGQAIGPGRYLLALARYQLAHKRLIAPDEPDQCGLVLQAAAGPSSTSGEPSASAPDASEAIDG